ncbi:MAG: ABC transporter ATP-binding protein, partial [Planctomycetota bacterium]
GDASVFGLPSRWKGVAIRKRTGYVPEEHHIYDWMTVGEVTRFVRAFYPAWDDLECQTLLSRFGLEIDKKVRNLSKGMVAKLALTLALAHKPELLVLDEPTSGLDPIVRRDFLGSMVRLIQEEGRTVFVSSHLIAEIEGVVDRVAIMRSGKILLVEDVGTLKEMTARVRLVFAEPPEGGEVAGALSFARNGRVWEAVIGDWSEEKGRELRARLAPTSMEVERLGLEDVFIAYVGKSE